MRTWLRRKSLPVNDLPQHDEEGEEQENGDNDRPLFPSVDPVRHSGCGLDQKDAHPVIVDSRREVVDLR